MEQYIYALVDPVTHLINYIGRTNNLYERWKQHVSGESGQAKSDWIRQLRMSGIDPVLIVLEEATLDRVSERESYWIDFGFAAGWPLKNYRRAPSVGFDPEDGADPQMLDDVIEFALGREFISTSLLQREMGIGYKNAKQLLLVMFRYKIVDDRFIEGKGFRVIEPGQRQAFDDI